MGIVNVGKIQEKLCLEGLHQGVEDNDARFKELFEYWDLVRPINRLPSRRHFDPVDIPALLPYLILLDVYRDPLRFTFRLIGTQVCRIRKRRLDRSQARQNSSII